MLKAAVHRGGAHEVALAFGRGSIHSAPRAEPAAARPASRAQVPRRQERLVC